MSKAWLMVVGIICFPILLIPVFIHEPEEWRDSPSIPCVRWAEHREGHDVWVKGIHTINWKRVHYCLEKPDASIYEDAR